MNMKSDKQAQNECSNTFKRQTQLYGFMTSVAIVRYDTTAAWVITTRTQKHVFYYHTKEHTKTLDYPIWLHLTNVQQ